MNTLARAFLAIVVLLPAAPAIAIDYSDWWWNADQSGQGINVSHQGNTVFFAWFTYDEQGNDAWLVLSGPLDGNRVTGPFYRATGPAFGTPFDPAQVHLAEVGTGTLTFAGTGQAANLGYSVYGRAGSIALVRYSFGGNAAALGGTWGHNQVGTYCDGTGLDNYGTTRLTISGDQYTMQFSHLSASVQCTLTGTIAPSGRYFRASGQSTCSSGDGTFSQTLQILDRMVMIWETRSVDGCLIQSQWVLRR